MRFVLAMLLLLPGCAYKNGEIFHDMLTKQGNSVTMAATRMDHR